MIRVQIPAYLDHWMRGDRYGVVVDTVRRRFVGQGTSRDLHTVKLDRSGKTIKVYADDCQEIA